VLSVLGVVDVTEASHEPEALVGQPEALLEGTVAGSEDLVSRIILQQFLLSPSP
jgi:hypothetical protein